MKIVAGSGSVAGLPVKGGAINLESADVAAIVSAATGLVKRRFQLYLLPHGPAMDR